jgi:peptide chain release factor 1
MYLRYCERQGWKVETLSASDTGIGGTEGRHRVGVRRGRLPQAQDESGTHRVQRVPETEASGRIHTSAVTVPCCPKPKRWT